MLYPIRTERQLELCQFQRGGTGLGRGARLRVLPLASAIPQRGRQYDRLPVCSENSSVHKKDHVKAAVIIIGLVAAWLLAGCATAPKPDLRVAKRDRIMMGRIILQ